MLAFASPYQILTSVDIYINISERYRKMLLKNLYIDKDFYETSFGSVHFHTMRTLFQASHAMATDLGQLETDFCILKYIKAIMFINEAFKLLGIN